MPWANKIFLYTAVLCVAVLAVYRVHEGYAAHMAKLDAAKDKTNTLFPTVSTAAAADDNAIAQSSLTHLSVSAPGPDLDYNSVALPHDAAQNTAAAYQYPAPPPDQYPDALPKLTDDAALQSRAEKAFDKYLDNPLIKQFNADIQKAGVKGTDFSHLATADMADAITQNPKLRDIFIKYSQNPKFIALIQQMGTDPEIKAATQELKNNR